MLYISKFISLATQWHSHLLLLRCDHAGVLALTEQGNLTPFLQSGRGRDGGGERRKEG